MDQYREVEQDDPVAAFEQLRGEVALLRRAVEGLIRGAGARPLHLGLSQAGHPKHPLYIPYAQVPEPWPAG